VGGEVSAVQCSAVTPFSLTKESDWFERAKCLATFANSALCHMKQMNLLEKKIAIPDPPHTPPCMALS